MSNLRKDVLFPAGRMVAGNLYVASDKDADGKPRVARTGPNQGQPSSQFYFAVAMPKTPGATHFSQEPWGAIIWEIGNLAFPKIAAGPTFAWKVTDGDSALPNKKGVAPNTREGYPGNWVVAFTSSYAPRIVNADGSAYILEVDAVKCGYFVQILGNVDGNGSSQNPGVYVNHSIVSFQGIGPEIRTGVDPASVGFGQGPKPAGVLAAPVGAFTPPAQVPAAAPLPTAVAPSPGFLAPAAAPPLPPAAPPAPPAAPVVVMTPKAQGATFESFAANGWTLDMLKMHGYAA